MLPTRPLNGDHSAFIVDQPNIAQPEFPPLGDHNSWYYPAHGRASDDEESDEPADVRLHGTNWGRKSTKGARWTRRHKICSWGPDYEDWQAEERARKRLKQVLPPSSPRSPSPPTLPHLRPDTPPLVPPYCPPATRHLSYTSYVMDKSVTHSFRSNLLGELEGSTNGLIQGEATLRRALGRLWEVMNEDYGPHREHTPVLPKQEDGEGEEATDETSKRLSRAPDLTPASHKLFFSVANTNYDSQTYTVEQENLERTMANLFELQDDMREYVERLEEIRDSLGDVRHQKNRAWDVVRERAIKELQDIAVGSV